ncbi:MAG: class I SAM-dependent methyltransferase [Planctomycetota bacterium]
MTTNYDGIAREYQASKLQPWRTHIERYTLLQLTGDVRGLKTLDLACGEGYYTRLLRRLGAEPVVGIDLSQGMIDLARAQEAAQPLGIRYCVGDARAVDQRPLADLVFAAYLLNYARNAAELLGMCEAIARNLKPSGRFVTVNNNPDDPPDNFQTGRAYGYSKRLEGPLEEGTPIVWRFQLPERAIEVTNFYLTLATMELALKSAGLRDIRWHPPRVSPEGLQQSGEEHWGGFLARPPIVFLECFK